MIDEHRNDAPSRPRHHPGRRSDPRIAIVGGGPSGLMTARLLERRLCEPAEITLFEASGRLGGKLHTRRFDAAPVSYEAGVAECYDVRPSGPDPLRELVEALGLRPLPMQDGGLVMHDAVLRDDRDLEARLGSDARNAVAALRRRLRELLPVQHWHRGFDVADNARPWARRNGAEILDEVRNPAARQYLGAVIHSDLATEPERVNGLTLLRSLLKSMPPYNAHYRIEGGMEMLPRRLAEQLRRIRLRLDSRVARVAANADGTYTLHCRGKQPRTFDALVLALPCAQLAALAFRGRGLDRAMAEHVDRFRPPGHYLRVSLLFCTPFWRRCWRGSWTMLDAFGGCCVYDETPARSPRGYGVLGWLLAGADALRLCSADDATLVGTVLDRLPAVLRDQARAQLIEAKVHRWPGAVSGQPGGFTLMTARRSHCPAPVEHPRLTVVGDHLFDSSLNGVLRSADIVAGLLVDALARRGDARPAPDRPRAATVS